MKLNEMPTADDLAYVETAKTVTLAQAESLAIRYCAYMRAADAEQSRERDMDIVVWGGMLLEMHREIGSTLVDEESTETIIGYAKRRLEDEA